MRARKFRLIDTGPGAAAWNMAVDEVLLRAAGERPAVRFYAWAPAARSIGYFQEAGRTRSGSGTGTGTTIVRRLTGGGAILHEDELTFSVAAPLDLLGGEGAGVRASFEAVNRAVEAGLALVGVEIDGFSSAESAEQATCKRSERRHVACSAGSALENDVLTLPFDCWKRRSDTDLRVSGRKLVGSAQRRDGRTALHHGSIPLGAQG